MLKHALPAALLLACSEQGPPPYEVYFAHSVPREDREVWGAAAAAWDGPLYAATGEHVFFVESGPADGRCGVEVVSVTSRPSWSPAEAFNGHCLMRVEYQRGALEACIAVHELGHRLIDDHVPGTVFSDYGCDYEPVVTPELVARVRRRWKL